MVNPIGLCLRLTLCFGTAVAHAATQGSGDERGPGADRTHASVVSGNEAAPGALRDWLTTRDPWRASLVSDSQAGPIELSNGLVRRVIAPRLGGVTVALDDLRTGAAHLRSLRPAARVRIAGVDVAAGGAVLRAGVVADHAFVGPLDDWAPDPEGLQLIASTSSQPLERMAWKRTRHASPLAVWPPRGRRLTLEYAPPRGSKDLPAGLRVLVHHELYDGVPVLGKAVEIRNEGDTPFVVERIVTEELAVVEGASWVETRDAIPLPTPTLLHAESEYAMGGGSAVNANRFGVRWLPDPEYATQVNYLRRMPCLLEIAPERSINRVLGPGESFTAPMAFLVVFDSKDATRRSLTLARFYEVIAPWTTENPLMMHVRHSDDEAVRLAIHQAAEVGFEMVILTFGSGFNMEDDRPEVLAHWKTLADEAHASGIGLGGYTLLSSRRIQPETDLIVNPKTGTPEGQTHGTCPALTSDWGLRYLARLRAFQSATGFDLIEHDGPYPGDVDARERLPWQHGAQDSRFAMWNLSAEFYRWCRARGVYVNAPDWYFLVGTNKTGMGYRETNWSLPRTLQVLHTRQNIFDGTRAKRPSMGWMFVPLTQYHGGGAAATVEPLEEHLAHYDAMLCANLGAGVQAAYRGPRLFDTEPTRDLVARRVAWFLAHREILEAPIIHSASRRADGRDVDWLLHGDPRLGSFEGAYQGMLVVYRPPLLREDAVCDALERELSIDLTYTGLARCTAVQADGPGGATLRLTPQADGRVRVPVRIPAGEPMTWFAFRCGD